MIEEVIPFLLSPKFLVLPCLFLNIHGKLFTNYILVNWVTRSRIYFKVFPHIFFYVLFTTNILFQLLGFRIWGILLYFAINSACLPGIELCFITQFLILFDHLSLECDISPCEEEALPIFPTPTMIHGAQPLDILCRNVAYLIIPDEFDNFVISPLNVSLRLC